MVYKESLLDKAQRKLGRYAIANLMNYIVLGMGVVFVMDMFMYPFTRVRISSLLAFSLPQILRGQIWRLVSFVFIPPNASLLFILFALYFYWLIGTTLEHQWGRFRFNAYYLCGMAGTILSGLLTGYATNHYLNLSLFLAFAILYPDFEVMLFFILPVKMKWLAILDAVVLVLSALGQGLVGWIALFFSLLNVALFFGRDLVDLGKSAYRRYKWRQNWRR